MRLRIKFWPQGMVSAISARATGKPAGLARQFFSWQGVGAAVLGVLLAKWTWLLFAPASPAMPAAAWEASGEAERVFGTVSVADTAALSSLGNIKLIGVFAHRTRGFAVMQVDEKQIGIGLGDEVKPGVKLVETHADYVLLERADIRQRVDLTGASSPSVAGPVPGLVVTASTYTPQSNAAPVSSATESYSGSGSDHPNGGGQGRSRRGGNGGGPHAAASLPGIPPASPADTLQPRLDAGNLPPAQSEMLQHKLDSIRGQH